MGDICCVMMLAAVVQRNAVKAGHAACAYSMATVSLVDYFAHRT